MRTPSRPLAGLLGLGLAATGLSAVVAAPASAADPVTINLLNINDFHGRIDENTTAFATTVEQLRAAEGEDNTLFLGAGDNIGASLFASSLQQDQPTIDVLNALGMNASAVGNHEFDKGFDDLSGRVTDAADWDYLGANVYQKGTTTPALPEYATFEVAGVTVAVVGAVTEETPTLVSPDGVADLEFGDPVEAVNRVAGELTDGDTGNGEAEVIVAEYHEGASEGTPEGATLEEEVAAGGAFADIVNNTSAEVDAIFTGHTHKEYAWDGPIPGSPGETRPILQTGSYGANVGQIKLTVDPDTGEVSAYTHTNVPRVATADTSLPRVAEVKKIVDAALDEAAEVGNKKVTTITGDVTTAYSGGDYGDGGYAGGARDDRSRESTLGGLVANALRDGVSDVATVDLGITNPGGLRAELLYAGDTSDNPVNEDGVVTYAEANAVLPFSNTIAVVTLTGAQLKSVLEEQWQPDGSSRPYLQLGLSDNVRVTADPTADRGSRITSVRIDDEPLDPAGTYKVSTFSFLAAGGDNFTSFTDGSYVDTGFLDAEMWRAYLTENAPITPDFARQQVFATGLPASVSAGQQVDVQLGMGATSAPTYPIDAKSLDLTSLGSPENTRVRVYLTDGTETRVVGSYPVTDGVAQVSFTAPDDLAGEWSLGAVALDSGTLIGAPAALAESTTSVSITPKKIIVKKTRPTVKVAVTAAGAPATGKVTIKVRGTTYSKWLQNGKVALKLPKSKVNKVGSFTVRVVYLGNLTTARSVGTATLKVVKK